MMYRKDLSLSFDDERSMELFIGLLSGNVKADMIAVSRMGHLYISLRGDPETVKRSIARIKELYKMVRSSGRRTMVKYPVDMLLSMAEVETPISLDTVAISLSIWGYRAALRGNHVVSDAPFELVVDTVSRISRIYEELRGIPMTPPVKRLASICAATCGKRPEDCVRELEAIGVARNVGGYYTLAMTYTSAVEHLKEYLARRGHDEHRHSEIRRKVPRDKGQG